MRNSEKFLYRVLFASCLVLFPVMAQSDEPLESDMPVIAPKASASAATQAPTAVPLPSQTTLGVPVPLPPPRVVSKEEGKMSDQCASSESVDRKNLCLAKQATQQKAFGYEVKNHGSYYCTLIKERDLQNYCYAVVGPTPSMCDSIIKPDIEKECKSNFKS